MPLMAQPEHPHPQEAPFFLSRRMLRIANAITAATINTTNMVPIFAPSQAIIRISSLFLNGFGRVPLSALPLSLPPSEQHIHHDNEHEDGGYEAGEIRIACKEGAELEDHEGYGVGEDALIGNGKGRPLCAVHFAADSTHGGNAGGAEKVKDEEGIARERGKTFKIQHAEHAHNFLFGDESHQSGHSGLDVAKAQRGENSADGAAE